MPALDVRVGGYALLALAVFKGLGAALAIEQATLPVPLLAIDILLILVSGLCGYAVLKGWRPGLALAVGFALYAATIAAHALHQPQTLIGGFFLKVGVLGAVGYSLYKLYEARRAADKPL